jgi:uncharacterized phage protein gp47/JayE
MILAPQPPVDERDYLEIFEELKGRAPGYTSELALHPGEPGTALGLIFARYVQTVLQRLNRAPEKNKLALLDMLGLQLTPAQSARAAIVFQLNQKSSAGIAPEGTALAAPAPPGSSEQIVFETGQALSVMSGKLVEVFSLWPARDSYIDHSAAYKKGLPMHLFAAAESETIPHHLYLAHEKLFALSGSAKLNLELQFLRPGAKPLAIEWEYWDGKVWRGFFDISLACHPEGGTQPDGTAGMSANGRIELVSDGAKSEQTTVYNAANYWIRGRLTQALPASGTTQLPLLDSVRLSSTVEQPFRVTLKLSGPEQGESAIHVRNAAGQPLAAPDTSVTVPDPTDPEHLTITLAPLPGKIGQFVIPNRVKQPASITVMFFGIQQTIAIDESHLFGSIRESLTVDLDAIGIAPDAALADGTKLDTTKPFLPFGQQPQPGSAFYFSNQEAFSKPGANLRLFLPLTSSPLGSIQSNDPANKRVALTPQIEWEYWNGRSWATLVPAPSNRAKRDFAASEIIDFTVPPDMEPTSVAGTGGLWMRARLVSGGFGYKQDVSWQAGTGANLTNTITYIVTQPPVLAGFQLSYTWQYGPFLPSRVITYNDFQYTDHTDEALWPGGKFAPYERTADVTPALYLGFDKPPPGGQIGILFDVEEQRGDVNGPASAWEYWDGSSWTLLSSRDETRNMRLPGIVSLLTEDNSAPLARFDSNLLHWVRARLKDDGPPGEPTVNGIYPNAVWASQRNTLRDVPVGRGNGAIDQVFTIPQIPILEGERIEIREIFGPRANIEWRVLALDLFHGDAAVIVKLEDLLAREGPASDVLEGDLRLRRDRAKKVTEVWVRWNPKLALADSGPGDRDYTIDRARGVIVFGDGRAGRVPPDGASILARFMQSGGGQAGNVPAKTIAQLRGVVPGIEAAFNPMPAEGGSDGESLQDFAQRGPKSLSHRGRAVDATDYATLAREASSAVGFSRAIPAQTPAGRPLPGWVTVLIIPRSLDSRPQPSFGLRQQVQDYIARRAPAELADAQRIFVAGPLYLEIDISAVIAPVDLSEGGVVEQAARETLAAFLHPLTGGPSGEGWDLGRSVYLSDVAAALGKTPGLDFIENLKLLLDGQDQGSSVAVGPDRIAVAGDIQILLTAPSR